MVMLWPRREHERLINVFRIINQATGVCIGYDEFPLFSSTSLDSNPDSIRLKIIGVSTNSVLVLLQHVGMWVLVYPHFRPFCQPNRRTAANSPLGLFGRTGRPRLLMN